ncbi:MAG: hypothetical protein AAGF75_06520, partial [Cyanobacteria bacterium P01_H01_bin.130]
MKRRNWWAAGAIAFVIGVGVGTLGDRNWQRGAAVGAIGLSALITVGTLQERRKLERPPQLKPSRQPRALSSTGLAFLDALPLAALKTKATQWLSRPSKKLPLPAARSKPPNP